MSRHLQSILNNVLKCTLCKGPVSSCKHFPILLIISILTMVLLYNYAFLINLSPSSGYKFLMPVGITRNVFHLIHKHFCLIFVLILIAASQSFLSDSSISSPLCLFRASPHKHTKSESCWVVSDSLRPHGLRSPRNSPGQNTGVGILYVLQGIFLTQESNWGLLHCKRILYQLSYQGSP